MSRNDGYNRRNEYGRNRRKRKSSGGLIVVFIITLTAVVSVGLVGILLYKWINPDNSQAESYSYNHYKFFLEAIPENATQEEVERAVEAQMEVVKEENSKYSEEIEDLEYLETNNIYVKEKKDNNSGVTLTFAGDILFDSSYAVMATLKDNGGNISSGIDQQLIDIMHDSDIMMLNNEFPYSYGGSATEGKQYTFRADPATASYLNDLDVDVVSLANNHAYDYGSQAFLDTMDALDSVGVSYVGAGHDIEEASAPVYYIINNIKIGILSATQIEKGDYPDTKGATDSTPGVFRCWNNKKLLEKISEVKENCDFVVVYIHWGTESTTEIDWAQSEQAPQMVSAGADLIIGDHPHVLQPISCVNGVPIVYSLGNFWFNSKQIDTCMVQATINEDGLETLRFIPCLQSGCKTKLLDGAEADRVISEMRMMSPKVSIDENGYITY